MSKKGGGWGPTIFVLTIVVVVIGTWLYNIQTGRGR